MNEIPAKDIKKMWRPWSVFENIEHKDDSVATEVPDIMTIHPNQEFRFQMDAKSNFRNTRLFKGDENVIVYQRQNTVKWVSD